MPVPNEWPPVAVPPPPRRFRSLLYVPASSGRMVAKAASRGADILVLDLEDGVHRGRKEAARGRLSRSLAELAAGGAAVAVRVNPPGSPLGRQDLEAIREAAREASRETVRNAGFAAVLLPKVETVAAVREAGRLLAAAMPLWLMIETARGAAAVFELAREDGVSGLVFGSADYRLSVGSRASPEERELDHARQRILLAARAAGVCCWDAPWFAFRDLEGLRLSARRAFELGFDGKSAIHPAQLPVIHEEFAPTADERVWAERVVRAMEDAGARGEAVAELDGELLEELHLRQAKRLLAR